jgi:hypothetical protein
MNLFAVLLVWFSGCAELADVDAKTRTVQDKNLRSELLRRTEADQKARFALIKWMREHGTSSLAGAKTLDAEQQGKLQELTARVQKADKENTSWLRDVVKAHGWPTISLVGDDGAKAAWLLVQHADADTKFQRRCLDLMGKLPENEVSQSNIAYLTDRVRLAEGKKQVYGTQFMQEDGKWKPRPLEDEANVDRRRAEVGLPPLAEYIRLIQQQYGGQAKQPDR